LLALIIFWAPLNLKSAPANPQFSLGDKLSVFSDKAYRKNQGKYFEAVGNVVIISQSDTIYGELASLNQETMMVHIEGNVRLITKDMTLYGSHVDYNIATGYATIKNARIVAMNYNLVANELIRKNAQEYLASEAEFTTCRDCAESWAVYGKQIYMKVNNYVTIKHGLAKIKGVDVLYLPYLILPIQTKRKTGLLFPKFSSRAGEGLALEQPVFWAIDESRDATFSPTFWARRGYGGDFQYRERFNDLSWIEANARLLNDTIYEPGKFGQDPSGREFFRYFTEIETHQQYSSNFNSHFRYTGARDLDIVWDHRLYTEPRLISSDLGFSGHSDYRHNYFSVGVEGQYLRNQLFANALEWDRSYVQTMPRVTLSSVPYSLIQSDLPLLQHMAIGFDSSVSRFRQINQNSEDAIRNADRLTMRPYVMWHLLTRGPFSLKTHYTYDSQIYRLPMEREDRFAKSAGLLRTEFSFTMDKIFGLAFEEKIPISAIDEKKLNELREKKEQGLTPLQKTQKKARLVGEIPTFEAELVRDNIIQTRNSYRHSQDFKFIHHFLTSGSESGSERFYNQIRNSNQGWFDYEDALRREEFRFSTPNSRAIIPPQNTFEFQWNNSLMKKSPRPFSYLQDDRYLRDNFTYTKIGWFDVSQGYLINEENVIDWRERLTRLLVNAGYNGHRWSVNLTEIYFHFENENSLNISGGRSFDSLNLSGSYLHNNFSQSQIKNLSFAAQVRPTEVLGLAMIKDIDLEANRNIRTTYALDLMPNNNCWILNLNYREDLNDKLYTFNVLFNFGDESFSRYRNNYFSIPRL
jgi:LPS-assembly protein